MSVAFDPVRWAQAVFVHPTRDQLERGYVGAAFFQLKKKLQLRSDSAGFAPVLPYHATVLIRGVERHKEGLAMMTAVRLFSEAPIGFDTARSHTFHVQLGQGRPFIGLVASEEPLDSLSVLAHFLPRGDEGR